MVNKCCVPQCRYAYTKNTVTKIRFHQFPNDKVLRKKWSKKIKRSPTKSSKVCSLHFKENDYQQSTTTGLTFVLKKYAIPSINLPKTKRRTDIHQNPINLLEQETSDCTTTTHAQIQTNEILPANYEVPLIDNELHNIVAPINFTVADINTSKTFCERSTQTDTATAVSPQKKTFADSFTQTTSIFTATVQTATEETMVIQESIKYNALTESDILFYTGLSIERFEALAEFLEVSKKISKFDKYISKKDQLVLTLIKYRRNLEFCLIAKLYGIYRATIREVFVFWTDVMFSYFKSTDFWSLRYISENSYTAIVDCTEIGCEHSTSDLRLNQSLFSNYKNRHTLKYLVAIDEKGTVIYCSDVYGGAISDKQIVEESGFLELLHEGDTILADRGFDVSDVLERKNVILNIPPFLRHRSQLTNNEIMETRIIANRRIHVERVIGLTKKFLILQQTFKASLWPYSNKIIYNANMLCNFKPSIV